MPDPDAGLPGPAMNPKQELQQYLNKFGWGARYLPAETAGGCGCWAVEVRVLPSKQGCHTFQSDDSSPSTKKGAKRGSAAAAALALEGLQPFIAAELAKPAGTMEQVFAHEFSSVRVLESSDAAWAELATVLAGSRDPAVGIDVEGNQSSPPVLVQVACTRGNLIILEVPSLLGGLSAPLQRLLADKGVRKVFCDGTCHADKTSLGLAADAAAEGGPLGGHIIELEDTANALLHESGVFRGLIRNLELSLKLGSRITKKDSGWALFAGINQGFYPQLKGLQDIPVKEQQYAALDAWCTLRAWEGFLKQVGKGSTTMVT